MANGWSKLGEALAGRSDADKQAIEMKVMGQLAQRDRALAAARMDIEKARALDSLGNHFADLGIANPEAAAGVSRSGINLNTLTSGLGNIQEQGFRQAARDKAIAGDRGGANAELWGVTNNPQVLPRVSGGMLISDAFVPGGGTVTPTAVGQSQIRANDARGQAALTRANRPASAGGGRAPAAGKLSQIDAMRLKQELRPLEAVMELVMDTLAREAGRPNSAAAVSARAKLEQLQAAQNAIFDKYEGRGAAPAAGAVDFVIDEPQNLPPQVVAALPSLAAQLAPPPEASDAINPRLFDAFQGSLTGQQPPARPTSKEEYDRLPKGTRFVAPDGTTRVKP